MENISATDGLSNKSSSSTEDLPSKVEGIAWCSAFALEAVLIVAGNLLTIVLFAANKKLRKRSLYLIINMAFADLMLGVVNVPKYILATGNDYQLWSPSWIASFYFLVVIEMIVWQASLLTAVMISFERFFAVYWPFKHLVLSVRPYRIATCVVWVLSILSSVGYVLLDHSGLNKYVVYLVFCCYFTLLFIICTCNVAIWRKFQEGGVASQQQNRAIQNKRLTKSLLFVSSVALLSILPFLIVHYLELLTEVSPVLVNIVFFLNFSNSFLNIVVYAWRIPEYKQALRSSCFGRQAVINVMEDQKSGNERGASQLPMPQLRTLPTDPSHDNMAYEQETEL